MAGDFTFVGKTEPLALDLEGQTANVDVFGTKAGDDMAAAAPETAAAVTAVEGRKYGNFYLFYLESKR